jgi:hypothetical protein
MGYESQTTGPCYRFVVLTTDSRVFDSTSQTCQVLNILSTGEPSSYSDNLQRRRID